jgi:hypothetical protein
MAGKILAEGKQHGITVHSIGFYFPVLLNLLAGGGA